jgi:hypothetical protein
MQEAREESKDTATATQYQDEIVQKKSLLFFLIKKEF